jgi:type IVB pilus formation R64 PilN family outer membrane protein
MKKTLISALLMGIAACLLASCSQTYVDSKASIAKTGDQIKLAERQANASDKPVIVKSGYYIDSNAVAISHNPNWLTRPITLQANSIPLNLLMNRVLRNAPAVTNYDNTVQKQQLVNIRYHGSIKGALDTLASETNYNYSVHPNDITWSAFQTKTFDISFMPGSSNYLVGQDQDSSSSSNTSSGGSSPVDQINDQQYSNLQAQLSLWHDLSKTLDQLKSKQGHVIVSESTTSVTVQDRPSNVKAIAKYILALNHTLTQQVSIKVQLLEIKLNKDFNYGVNWNLVTEQLGTQFNLVGSAASSTNLVANSAISSGGSGLSTLGIGSNGTDAVINALNQQGEVRVVTEPQVVTMNNQIAAIRITQSVGYLESVSQTTSQSFSTSSVTPGSITDGFTLYLLPKIQNEKIYMQISSTIASLDKLDKVSTDPASSTSSSSTQYQAIQVPTLSQKSFNQRSLVSSGSTLIVAGFKQMKDATSDASLFGIKPLGGRGASTNNIETLMLITPVVLHSSKSNVHINT